MVSWKTVLGLLGVLGIGILIAVSATLVKEPPPLIMPEAFDAEADQARRASPDNGYPHLASAVESYQTPPEGLADRVRNHLPFLFNENYDPTAALPDAFGLLSSSDDAAVRDWLAANETCLAHLQAAADRPYMLYPHPPASLAPRRWNPVKDEVLALLVCKVSLALLMESLDGAPWLTNALRIIRGLSVEADRRYRLRATEALLYQTAEETARRSEDAAFLSTIADVLEEMGEPWPDALPLLQQYWKKIDWDLMYVPDDREEFGERMEATFYLRAVASWAEDIRALRPDFEHAASLPAAEAEAFLRTLPAFLSEPARSPRSARERRWRLQPNLELLINAAELKLRYHAALTALRIRRFMLQNNGQLPEAADSFAREELPADPFTGKPYLGTAGPEGWNLYSTGRDGTDDGGKTKNDFPLWSSPFE
jgi:hypothetical protein